MIQHFLCKFNIHFALSFSPVAECLFRGFAVGNQMPQMNICAWCNAEQGCGCLRVQVQRSAKVGAPGLVNFITAVAYHFCPSLPAAFTQPGASTLADLCILPSLVRS